MFQLSNVRYKDVLCIDSLHIPEGKVTCIVGPSGSGKTTLLRLLNHLISPDAGTITFRGTDLMEIDPVALRRKVVMLQQNPVMFPGTIRDNLVIGCRFAQRPLPHDSGMLSILNQVGLKHPLDADTAKLSGGEKQRIALARVLLMEPSVLLLDEPSSALDDETEKLVVDLITAEVRSRSRTLVMVTHSKTVARNYADIIVTIAGGCVAQREVVYQ